MTTEQQLVDALRAARGYEPSRDLWRRVLHSIEEDRRHRRRVWATSASIIAALSAAIAVASLNVEATPRGARIDWRVMEALETVGLAVIIAALGPAIRRFGRGYVTDLFGSDTEVAPHVMRLLDLAYYLIFTGYLLMTIRVAAPIAYVVSRLGDQVSEAAVRIGGLLLVMGVLHAVSLMVLPLLSLVYTATRTGHRLPRWVNVLLVLGGLWAALNVLPGLLVLGGS